MFLTTENKRVTLRCISHRTHTLRNWHKSWFVFVFAWYLTLWKFRGQAAKHKLQTEKEVRTRQSVSAQYSVLYCFIAVCLLCLDLPFWFGLLSIFSSVMASDGYISLCYITYLSSVLKNTEIGIEQSLLTLPASLFLFDSASGSLLVRCWALSTDKQSETERHTQKIIDTRTGLLANQVTRSVCHSWWSLCFLLKVGFSLLTYLKIWVSLLRCLFSINEYNIVFCCVCFVWAYSVGYFNEDQ